MHPKGNSELKLAFRRELMEALAGRFCPFKIQTNFCAIFGCPLNNGLTVAAAQPMTAKLVD